MIQKAHKKADNNFNDFVAQLYEQEFKTQEKAKEEHIRQSKEKAIEEQRKQDIERQRQETEVINQSREGDRENTTIQNNSDSQNTINTEANIQTPEPTQQTTIFVIGDDWSQVSPEIAANYMASKTGVSTSKWLDVIYKESSGNPYVENSLTCWGYLQIMQSVHGQVSNLSPQEYLDKAVSIYQSSGGTAWATW